MARIEIPKEFRSAEVNRSWSKTDVKLSHVQSFGKNVGASDRNVSGLLKESETIHSRGNSAHSRMRTPQNVHQLLVLRPSITHPP